jgi:hypothetical protein
MALQNLNPNQPQLFAQTITGGEVPHVYPGQIAEAARLDEAHVTAIATSGENRDTISSSLQHSEIVTQDMGLYRGRTEIPELTMPAGPTFELSGRGSGRQSGHSRPLSRAEMREGLSPEQIERQQAINAAGILSVRAANEQAQDGQALDISLFDPATGRAIIGAAAKTGI